MRLDRLNKMEEYILQYNNVSLETLASHFSISINTVRRDIAEILKKGTIKKVYGGVMAIDPSRSSILTAGDQSSCEAKQVIGSLAASLIKDDDTIFLDSGTTVVHIIPFLENKKNITIVTNSLRVINACAMYPQLNLLVMGGYYDDTTQSFAGTRTLDSIGNVPYDLALLGTTGISLTRGLTTVPFFEETVKQLIITRNPGRVALMVDHSKFGKSALRSFGKLEDISYLITDKCPEDEYMEKLQNCKLLYPDVPHKG